MCMPVGAGPKWKPKGKGNSSLGEKGSQKAASAPSSPLKTEGPVPPKKDLSSAAPKLDGPGKGKAPPGRGSGSQDRPVLSKNGQQCIHFYRGICSCGHSVIMGISWVQMASRCQQLRNLWSARTNMRPKERCQEFNHPVLGSDALLSSLEKTASCCYWLLDSGANGLVLPKVESMHGQMRKARWQKGTLSMGW